MNIFVSVFVSITNALFLMVLLKTLMHSHRTRVDPNKINYFVILHVYLASKIFYFLNLLIFFSEQGFNPCQAEPPLHRKEL